MHSILAARTDFSVGESILTVEQLVDQAKLAGETVVAITDTMSVTGMIDFTNRAKKAGIKPIIGCRLRLSDKATWRPEKGQKKKDMPADWYLSVYALTDAGMKAIFRLLTLGYSEERFYYNAKLDFVDLYTELDRLDAGDLAVTLGDVQGVMLHPDARDIIAEIRSRLMHVYAPLVPVQTPYFARTNEIALELIANSGLQPIVVRPSFYEKDAADAHEFMTAIASGNRISDPWHRSTFNRDFHVVSGKELTDQAIAMAKFMGTRAGKTGFGPVFMKGIANTDELVSRVSYEWTKAPVSLPKMADDEFDTVRQLCVEGWKTRFSDKVFGHLPTKEELVEVYKPRLAYELGVLKNLNFSGYFLLVHDVVQFAKKSGILVGPGRGSVGGSLVAYLMGITDCDPIRFNLLFERFINPDRIDLPDADLDFMSERRHEVVDYLVKKYGDKRVAGVSNFGTLAAASSIRDVSKAFGLDEREYAVSKLVPKAHGANVPLPKCAELVPEIQEFADNNPGIWPIMTRLEGTIRNFSQHAAGIVVGGVDLVERGVIERRKEDSAVVCWDKRIVEDQGLVKMDILGLNTLDLIKLTLDYIKERHSKRVNLMHIPLDDPKVLKNFAEANTVGIFQFESGGMRRLLKELGKDGVIDFEDITAATALYRPGPMESGMMDSYYKRKQGLELVEYDHPLMAPILKPTFGVMVYQEQVMQVARAIAGYSAAGADKLRKIMGKKLPEEMAKERGKFVEGCVKTIGADERWAGQLFDKIEGFAGYGFNRSHSVEYTLISYQSMFLKTYYPVEFYAAALTLLGEEKLPALLRDAAHFGIKVGMPDINISTGRFEIANDTLLVIPFQRIKGISGNTTGAILEARKAGPFKDKADFLARVNKTKCNKRHQEVLDKVGAFVRIEPGTPAAEDPSRIRDQIELIPGLVTGTVPIHRDMHRDKDTLAALAEVIEDCRKQTGLNSDDRDADPVKPWFGRDASFVIVIDAPSASESVIGDAPNYDCVIEAIEEAGLTKQDAMWTSLVKRPKEGKQLAPHEIAKYAPHLAAELKVVQSPVVVLLGSGVVRHFIPDLIGKASDSAGKVVYSPDFDTNFVIGFNPGEIYYAPEKQAQMNEVFQVVNGLLA